MRPVHTLALTLCLACLAPAARADDATHRAKVEEMLQITKAGSALQGQLKDLQDRVNGLAKQQFGQGTQTPEQAKLMQQYLQQVQTITADEVGWDKLHPLVVQNYSETFTDPELDGIIAFYKTPAGQALITKSPELLNKTNATVTARIKEMQPKLQELTQSYGNRIKAAAAPTAPATGPSLSTPKPAAKQ